jgi:DNA-binding NarL/FixJ family response regulator
MISEKIRVVIVDDNKLYSNTLAELLKPHGIVVAGQAGNNEDLEKLVNALQPDVVLFDYVSAGQKFNLAVKSIIRLLPQLKLLILSFESNPDLIDFFVTHGAKGFYIKNQNQIEDLVKAIVKISRGEIVKPEFMLA